jgi:hypothetical protein
VLGLPIRRSRLRAVVCPTATLKAHSISTTRVTLESFLPPSGHNGKAHRQAETLRLSPLVDRSCYTNRLLRAKIKLHFEARRGCGSLRPLFQEGVVHKPERIEVLSTGCKRLQA